MIDRSYNKRAPTALPKEKLTKVWVNAQVFVLNSAFVKFSGELADLGHLLFTLRLKFE